MENREKILKMFDDNYLEDMAEIIKIVEKAEIEHACTAVSLLIACLKIKAVFPYKTSLKTDVQNLSIMADKGYQARFAGERLGAFYDTCSILEKDFRNI